MIQSMFTFKNQSYNFYGILLVIEKIICRVYVKDFYTDLGVRGEGWRREVIVQLLNKALG